MLSGRRAFRARLGRGHDVGDPQGGPAGSLATDQGRLPGPRTDRAALPREKPREAISLRARRRLRARGTHRRLDACGCSRSGEHGPPVVALAGGRCGRDRRRRGISASRVGRPPSRPSFASSRSIEEPSDRPASHRTATPSSIRRTGTATASSFTRPGSDFRTRRRSESPARTTSPASRLPARWPCSCPNRRALRSRGCP